MSTSHFFGGLLQSLQTRKTGLWGCRILQRTMEPPRAVVDKGLSGSVMRTSSLEGLRPRPLKTPSTLVLEARHSILDPSNIKA